MMLTNPPARANLCLNEFSSSQIQGTSSALCRSVQRFFYAPNSMMAGVIGSLTARMFLESCLLTSYNRRRHSLVAVFDGLTPIQGHKLMPRKKATGATAPNAVQISVSENSTILIKIEQIQNDDIVIRKADVLACEGYFARVNFVLRKTRHLWEA